MPFFFHDLFDGVLSDKEYAKCVSSAMGGYGTARAGYHNVLKDAVGFYLLDTSVDDLRVASCMGNENVLCAEVCAVTDAVLNVHRKNACKVAAVLLGNAHFTALNCDAGLEI